MTARVQAVLDFLALAPGHRVRLARKAVGVPPTTKHHCGPTPCPGTRPWRPG